MAMRLRRGTAIERRHAGRCTKEYLSARSAKWSDCVLLPLLRSGDHNAVDLRRVFWAGGSTCSQKALGFNAVLSCRLSLTWACCGCSGFGAPTPRTALEHVAVMQQAIEHGADCGDIAEQLAPVLDGTIGSQQSAEAFVAAH